MTLVRRATADALGLHERASATPSKVVRRAASGPAVTDSARGLDRLALRAQQEWLANAIMTPESRPLPVDAASAARVVTAGPALDPLDRVEIYRYAYHARLAECLADDYPVLKHALGDEVFDSLCRAYIERHPSHGFSLNAFGRHMPEFCRAQPLPDPLFASDLATLEWAIVSSIHAKSAPPLTSESLAAVPSDRWADVRLVANPTLRILRLSYPANAYLQEYRTGGSPAVPRAASSAVAVYRTGVSIWRMELEPPTVVLFEALSRGATLGQSIGEVEPLLAGMDETEAAGKVMGWFRDGVASGLFCGVLLET